MRKRSARMLAFLLLFGILIAVFSGCGKKEQTPEPSKPESAAPQKQPDEPQDETPTAPACSLEAADAYDAVYTVLKQAASTDSYSSSADMGVIEAFFSREDIPTYAGNYGESRNLTAPWPEGVSAADLTVYSGGYLYSVAGGELRVIAAQGAQTKQLSATPVCTVEAGYDNYEETAQAIAVSGTHAAVITYVYAWTTQEQADGSWGSKTVNETRVKLYDVTDPAAPKQAAVFAQDGGYSQAVLSGSTLYLLTDYYVYDFDQADVESFAPHAGGSLVPATQILLNPQCQTAGYTVVSAVSMETGAVQDSCAVTGAYSAVFPTASVMDLVGWCYAATVSEPYQEEQYEVVDYNYTAVTLVGQLDLSEGLTFKGSSCVTGRMTDLGAIDVKDGMLRLSTMAETFTNRNFTDGEFGWENVEQGAHSFSNEIHILDADLSETGSLTGLSEDALLYYVRFVDDAAYVLAYEKQNPAYVIDLTDPTAPQRLDVAWKGLPERLLPYDTGKAVAVLPDAASDAVSLALADLSDPGAAALSDAVQTEASVAACIQNENSLFVSQTRQMVALPSSSGVVLYGFGGGSLEQLAEIAVDGMADDIRLLEADNMLYICGNAQVVAVEMTGYTVVAQSASAVG